MIATVSVLVFARICVMIDLEGYHCIVVLLYTD